MATPRLHRIPKEMQKPRPLMTAMMYRLGMPQQLQSQMYRLGMRSSCSHRQGDVLWTSARAFLLHSAQWHLPLHWSIDFSSSPKEQAENKSQYS
ncbi:Vesicular glutamate transporter 3, partial [Schistosoma japonicum]